MTPADGLAVMDAVAAAVAADPGLARPLLMRLALADPAGVAAALGEMTAHRAALAGTAPAGCPEFIRPGQVAADRPARDACMTCGAPEAAHPARPRPVPAGRCPAHWPAICCCATPGSIRGRMA